ncbi:MAG TPA: disulfide bond formation protein DsbA, partial [Rhodobacteraceae bacterium]|nr:disulfide bond formation protein DsbA [Paracoccaceae bacterium]
MKTFDFIFDFGSPNVYLMHKIMNQIEDLSGSKANYIPVLLGGIFKLTNNKPPLVQFDGIKGKIEYDQRVLDRFIHKYNIPFRFNSHFPVMTTAVMRGALFAQDKDYHSQYLNVVFEAIWQHNLKMDDPEIIKITLENAGLPATEIMDGAKQDEIKKGLFATTQAAVDRGAFGAPMIFVGDEPFFGK